MTTGARRVGVEEELMLVDPATARLVPCADEVIAGAHAAHGGPPGSWPGPSVNREFFQEQAEAATRPCTSLDDLAADLRQGRLLMQASAQKCGVTAVAMPTPVVAQPPGEVTAAPRYQQVQATYGRVAHESTICAMHVHVAVADETEGVAVLDRMRPWIPLLLALSANSPYWRGADTGYSSWRWQVWRRWPSTGPAEPFGDPETYHAVSRRLLDTGAVGDLALLNYEVRLSSRYPTVELRVADVCTDLDDAVTLAGLTRGLVDHAAASWRAGADLPSWRSDVLRAASWRAARSGLSDGLLHPLTGQRVDAALAVATALDTARESLEAAGDLDRVSAGLDKILWTGTGADRQRRAHAAHGDLRQVVADLARRTHRS